MSYYRIFTFVDGYDAVGNRTGRNHNGVVTTWVYDDAYRLTGQLQSGQRATFAHDASGNITLKHHEGSNPMSMTFDAANRLVTMQQGSNIGTYTFDGNGNMTGELIGGFRITYVYDQENRQLQEIRSSGSRHTYTYEPDGLRRSAFHAGTSDVVTFVWDGDDLLNERIEGANAARYAVVDGEVLSEKRGVNRYRFVPDPLGSVRAVLDTSGSIVATRHYWPYGETAAQTGGMTSLQYVGILGYFTDATGRIYIRARHYRPDLGRWVTVDPIGFASGEWNLYGYVHGSPVWVTDASGMLHVIVDPACERPPYGSHQVAWKVRNLCNRLRNDPSCGHRCGDWAHTYRCLIDKCNTTIVVKCLTRAQCLHVCPPPPPCACAAAPSGTVNLCPDALTRGCGCLQDTILHEMVHGCGHGDESCPNCMAGDCTRGLPLCPR